MPKLTRAATATALAAAVLVGAAAPAGAVFTGGMPDQFTPDSWESGTGSGNGFAGGIVGGDWQESQPTQPAPNEGGAAPGEQEQEPLPGPPERLEAEAALGEIAEAAKKVAHVQQYAAEVAEDTPEQAQRAAEVSAEAGAKLAQLAAEAAQQAAEPTNLGIASAPVSAPQVAAEDLLTVKAEDFPEDNVRAESAWQWLMVVKAWRGYGFGYGDGEALHAPEHPDYAERATLARELPESIWVHAIQRGDITEHGWKVLDSQGWEQVGDLLLPPEAL